MKKNILKNQKRVSLLKRRTTNINLIRDKREIITLIANKNHRITEEEIKSIKMDILTPKGITLGKLTKFYNINILMTPNKILTQKGILVRMGGGKAKVKSKVLYLTPGKSCIILKPKFNNLEIKNKNTKDISRIEIPKGLVLKILKKFLSKYRYFSILELL